MEGLVEWRTDCMCAFNRTLYFVYRTANGAIEKADYPCTFVTDKEAKMRAKYLNDRETEYWNRRLKEMGFARKVV